MNRQLKRARFLEFFANRSPCLIGMETCGGAHHWARQFIAMGHQVKLMPARLVKAFNIGNKSDAADARAIWLAVQQPCKPVAVKSEMQQAVLCLHRMRSQLMKISAVGWVEPAKPINFQTQRLEMMGFAYALPILPCWTNFRSACRQR